MPAPALSVEVRDLRADNADLRSRVHDLIAETSALQRLVTEMKAREGRLVRTISNMLNTPAQSVASAKYTDGTWEVVMTTGAVWQRVERLISTTQEHRYVEVWVPRPAVPGSRAEYAAAVLDDDAGAPLHLLPGTAA